MINLSCYDIQIPNVGLACAIGNLNFLHDSRVAVLNSRQGKFPDASAEWIRTTLELTDELVRGSEVVVSSVGMFTWELVTWKVSACDGKLIIVIPEVSRLTAPELAADIVRDFSLDERRVLFVFPKGVPRTQESTDKLPKRDTWIVALADTLYPIAIRPGGNLAKIIEFSRDTPGKVNENFIVPCERSPRRSFNPKMLTIASEMEESPWNYLTHWTSATVEPWPGETRADFCAAFERTEKGYPRSAFHTLKRILKQRCLRASNKLIRGEEVLVSLTACPPWELAKLVKWRPRLVRWTFEPYGVALNRQRLESLGTRPVVYGEDYQYRLLQDPDKPFFQSCGRGENNWRVEKEWRYRGDLDLSIFRPEDATVFVFTEEEAAILQKDSFFPIVCWRNIPKRFAPQLLR